MASLDSAQRQCIDYRKRFPACFDHEQSFDFVSHSLVKASIRPSAEQRGYALPYKVNCKLNRQSALGCIHFARALYDADACTTE